MARRERPRKSLFKVDRQEIVNRVLEFYENDDTDRGEEKEARIQRYAKYRMWFEEKDWPWADSSNVPLSDMMEKSFRMQDTIHNAVMSSRPVIQANASDRSDKVKESSIDILIDQQVFVEQDGEEIVGDLADAFVTDGTAFVFVPWVKESRQISQVEVFPGIPNELEPSEYFAQIVETAKLPVVGMEANGWDWRLDDDTLASFFTAKDGSVEMIRREEVEVYNGPRIIPKEWDEVLFPARAANLRRPSPSNPHGAGHVILVDYPSVDEIVGLAKRGVYDWLTKEDLDSLAAAARDNTSNDEMRQQKDTIQGVQDNSPDDKKAPEQKTMTRLRCFDLIDVDGDGVAEDMVWVVIKDIRALASANFLTELHPSQDGHRPIFSESLMPVRGRVCGISLPEMMEGLHDVSKIILDQTIDSGTLQNSPFWFYRPSGSMKPEIISLSPGEGYPLNDPQRDAYFPSLGRGDQTFGLNMLTLLQQWQDHLTTIGPLQLGSVPQGKASALRTVGGMSLIAGQGEARPERILRRFFLLLANVWRHIHGLNQIFLPEEKKIRVIGLKDKPEDPYLVVGKKDVQGTYEFDFKANVLNTSKQGLQQSISALAQAYISPLTIQLGIIDPDGIFQLLRKLGQAFGQDPDQYLRPPDIDAFKPKILAEEAITEIIDGQIPNGRPGEPGGSQEHLQKLMTFQNSDDFGLLDDAKVQLFAQYFQQIVQRIRVEQQQAQAIQAAAQQQMQGGQGQPGRPAESIQNPGGNPPVQPGELLNEGLPGAGGGGNGIA